MAALLTEWVWLSYIRDLRDGVFTVSGDCNPCRTSTDCLLCLSRQESSRHWFRFLASVDGAQGLGVKFSGSPLKQ